MTTIGKLNLQLTANPSGFATGLDKAGRAMQNFGGLVTGVLKNFTSPTALFGNLGNLFHELVTEQFDVIDEISKQADVLGLSTEALTTFQHAAELAGVTSEELGKGLEFLTRNLGKAAIVTETAGATLERFGLKADDLAAMSADDLVPFLAGEYVKLSGAIDKAAFSTAVFGKQGIKMSKFLEDIGTQGIASFRKEADLLARTFSREQGAEVERAGDAIARISLAFDGLKRQLAIGIAPIVADITDQFMKWLDRVGGVKPIAQKIVMFFLDLGEVLIGIGETIADIINEVKQFNLVQSAFGTGLSRFAEDKVAGRQGGSRFTDARDTIDRARRNMAGLGGGEAAKRFQPARTGLVGGLGFAAALAARDLAEDIDKLQTALTKQIDTWGMSADAITLWELKLRGATDAQLENIVALQEQLAGMGQLQELAREALTLPEAALAGTSAAVSAINRFNANREQRDNPNARLEAMLGRVERAEQQAVGLLRGILEELRGDQL